jgi:DNA-binding SARP family transcriptional activator
LGSLLFAEAEDPRRALRWNLSEIRRALGDHGSIGDDPVTLTLEATVRVDVLTVFEGSTADAIELAHLGADLLDGLDLGGPAFETWLLTERRHIAAASEAVLHEAALASISRGDHSAAIDLAVRVVEMNPLDENHQALLIRAFRLAGDLDAAERQLDACRRLFQEELGVSPGPAVEAAAKARAHLRETSGGRASARAGLEAGQAAVAAGALESGLATLEQTVAQADDEGDQRLRAEARIALAEALIHSLRGEDEEGTTALHEATRIAEEAGEKLLAARAQAELGYVDFLRARYDRAEQWLTGARRLSAADTSIEVAVASYLGSIESDRANYNNAARLLGRGIELAQSSGNGRREAYAQSVNGRLQLLRGEFDKAVSALEASIELGQREHWLAFLPWPQALLGEVWLKQGLLDRASELLEQAFARACQVGDPCWEGASARALALLAEARGDSREAIRGLEDARLRCNRMSDTYMWLDGYILDALCDLGRRHGHPNTRMWADQLHQLAARTGMNELTVRALLHQSDLGSPGALEMARVLSTDIDNPMLEVP